jgi:NADP-dependent aldehyde dehydrogenase
VPAYTSVGTAAIRRWLVPVAYQNFPPELLPPGLAYGGLGQAERNHRGSLPLLGRGF